MPLADALWMGLTFLLLSVILLALLPASDPVFTESLRLSAAYEQNRPSLGARRCAVHRLSGCLDSAYMLSWFTSCCDLLDWLFSMSLGYVSGVSVR